MPPPMTEEERASLLEFWRAVSDPSGLGLLGGAMAAGGGALGARRLGGQPRRSNDDGGLAGAGAGLVARGQPRRADIYETQAARGSAPREPDIYEAYAARSRPPADDFYSRALGAGAAGGGVLSEEEARRLRQRPRR